MKLCYLHCLHAVYTLSTRYLHVIYRSVSLTKQAGQTYERAAIEDWLESKSTDPMTGDILKIKV